MIAYNKLRSTQHHPLYEPNFKNSNLYCVFLQIRFPFLKHYSMFNYANIEENNSCKNENHMDKNNKLFT